MFRGAELLPVAMLLSARQTTNIQFLLNGRPRLLSSSHKLALFFRWAGPQAHLTAQSTVFKLSPFDLSKPILMGPVQLIQSSSSPGVDLDFGKNEHEKNWTCDLSKVCETPNHHLDNCFTCLTSPSTLIKRFIVRSNSEQIQRLSGEFPF